MYYRGDYYGRGRGDYYRGDPFLGALVPIAGSLIKKGAQALLSRARSGGAAGAATAGAAIAGGAIARLAAQGSAHRTPQVGFKINPMAALPGGRPFIQPGEIPRGFHLAKDGSGRLVRNRSMNVGNAAALRRAITRQNGFVGLAKRMGMVMPKGRASKILKPPRRKR